MTTRHTKFYRDKDNGKWAGVCAGISDGRPALRPPGVALPCGERPSRRLVQSVECAHAACSRWIGARIEPRKGGLLDARKSPDFLRAGPESGRFTSSS